MDVCSRSSFPTAHRAELTSSPATTSISANPNADARSTSRNSYAWPPPQSTRPPPRSPASENSARAASTAPSWSPCATASSSWPASPTPSPSPSTSSSRARWPPSNTYVGGGSPCPASTDTRPPRTMP
ncbi:hypothetical protein BO82DRAFT_75736 [Aspergillus uvarum CBS 121591]|uniref:Uncharacterized protein n=1 Tax=Aspergillus uvarum CBS 121591 TaxID=1448315 RepID=A0A319DRN9_9EURO|nr:hypothetical protein BO82DRAFT_75736 [Aspergillus uvarum CBS 121591]PYH81872.1 hypothetical protein BO82DRAFT_75736 [Aspergillus uvarum CBS 121591]